MKPKPNASFIAASAAFAFVASMSAAHAQGMPESAQQRIQTMRPMYSSQAAPVQTPPAAMTAQSSTDDAAYGGMRAGTSASASGGNQTTCNSNTPQCNVFFGQ